MCFVHFVCNFLSILYFFHAELLLPYRKSILYASFVSFFYYLPSINNASKQAVCQPASQVNHENRHVGKGKNNCSYWQKVYLAKARRAKEKRGKTVLHTTSFHSKNNSTNKHPNKQNPIHNFENELKRCA